MWPEVDTMRYHTYSHHQKKVCVSYLQSLCKSISTLCLLAIAKRFWKWWTYCTSKPRYIGTSSKTTLFSSPKEGCTYVMGWFDIFFHPFVSSSLSVNDTGVRPSGINVTMSSGEESSPQNKLPSKCMPSSSKYRAVTFAKSLQLFTHDPIVSS